MAKARKDLRGRALKKEKIDMFKKNVLYSVGLVNNTIKKIQGV